MSPKEAAKIVGCTPDHLRRLIRLGKVRSRKTPSDNNRHGFEYEISLSEAERLRDNRPPRGRKPFKEREDVR